MGWFIYQTESSCFAGLCSFSTREWLRRWKNMVELYSCSCGEPEPSHVVSFLPWSRSVRSGFEQWWDNDSIISAWKWTMNQEGLVGLWIIPHQSKAHNPTHTDCTLCVSTEKVFLGGRGLRGRFDLGQSLELWKEMRTQEFKHKIPLCVFFYT